MKKRIAIDLVPIRVGEGGTGSGIWTYARELLTAMDSAERDGLEIICLINGDQVPYLLLKNIQTAVFKTGRKNILKRLFWVHVRLPLWCRKNRVDALHKVATETPWFCSAQRVTTIHDFYYEYLFEQRDRPTLRLYERLEHAYFMFVTRLCFRKSKALIAVSNATRSEAAQRYPACEDRIHVVHHGSPADRARPPGEPQRTARRSVPTSSPDSKFHAPCAMRHADIENGVFNILCVAKFMEHKGQHLLIEAFERLLTNRPELSDRVCLSLRGFHNDGDYYRSVVRQVESSSCRDLVELIPYNAEETAADIYADTDLVVLLSEYEGFGLPVLEAQAFGIPVLCSDLPVLKEVGGEGAVYVCRSQISQITSALERFINDEAFCADLREKALANTKRFAWSRAATQTIAVYMGVLTSRD
jgi:glycosyltransferase involved in cell wall biosynthesis